MSDLNLNRNISKTSEGFGSQSFNEIQDDYDYEFDEGDLNNQITDEDVTFIPEADILKEREKLIKEAKEKLFLERDQAILAMIYYEWQSDNLDNWYQAMKNLLIILKFLISQILSQENKAFKNTIDTVELINIDSIDINKEV